MAIIRSRPNPRKKNPSLAHLRRVIEFELEAPPVEPGRYEKELDNFWKTHYTVTLSGRRIYFTENGRQLN